MSTADNPYGGGEAAYSQNVSFGQTERTAQVDPAASIRDATTASFSRDVLQESRNQPVLVDFWAPWCGPCKQLTPVLEKVVREAKGAVKLVKMNIDEHPSIPGQLGIQSIPAVIAFRNGQPVDGFMGAIPESEIRAFLGRIGVAPAGGASDEAIEVAAAAATGGDVGRAVEIYASILQREPTNTKAISALAGLLLDAGDVDGAADIVAAYPADAKETQEIAGIRSRIELAQEVAKLGDPAELERRLADDPKDHAARFDLAMIQNARGEKETAAESLLAIVRSDRTWRDDGARAQLLKFFEAWGPSDEATLGARRKLSSLLFS